MFIVCDKWSHLNPVKFALAPRSFERYVSTHSLVNCGIMKCLCIDQDHSDRDRLITRTKDVS